jgi:hypothetical protein
MAGLLTILINLFKEVCLTMGLHSSFLSQQFIFGVKQNVVFFV